MDRWAQRCGSYVATALLMREHHPFREPVSHAMQLHVRWIVGLPLDFKENVGSRQIGLSEAASQPRDILPRVPLVLDPVLQEQCMRLEEAANNSHTIQVVSPSALNR